MIYYLTYGSDDPAMPYQKGWTEVEAPDITTAIKVFSAVHPQRNGPFINCDGIYPADRFEKSEMFRSGNLGVRCHERITLKIERSTA